MRHALVRGPGLAAALVAHAFAGGPETKPAALKGKAVVLEAPPPTQLREIGRPRPLGVELRIGDAVFRTSKSGQTTFIATLAGGTPTTAAKPGESVTLTWKDGATQRRLRVGFAALPDGALGAFHATAWRFVVAGATVTLIDGNLDGLFGDAAKDGLVVGESGFVLPLGAPLVLGRSRVAFESIAPDGSSMTARVEPVKGEEQQLVTLEALNRVRLCVGMLPVDLDDAKCVGCTNHGRYLAANRWNGDSDPHDEKPGAPGFTEEGRRASQSSVIIMDTPTEAVSSFWRTWYHREPIVVPKLTRVGIGAAPRNISVIDVGGDSAGWDVELWSDVVFAPADGSSGVPTTFWPSGESPQEPVPDAGRRGMPLMAVFASDPPPKADLVVTLVELRGDREAPVKTLPADPWQFPEALGVVPEAPLSTKSAYRATFRFTRGGKQETRVVRFRTE